ncbi:hypothetical protein J2X69_003822 [Algoriphagus sp. 4150]|uniref:hypothetical protein n=1 Tax=Algoriphagus sp. 4150 TaxID=2817756 RepID=UPI00285CF776|nr:hypothetical protein [Algoriphagus sp. 4150]MDR7131458.1 hypothetical protein [Algoriphagus sp. 4150]
MIFYQIRSKQVKVIEINELECPNCKNKGHLQLFLFLKYTWIFAPILPAGKTAILECNSCEQTIPIKNWTKKLDVIFKTEKKNFKTPFYYYSGAVFILLIWLIPFTMMKMGITNPFGLNDDSKTMGQAIIDRQHIKENDILYVNLLVNGEAPKFKAVKVVKAEDEKVAYIKQSIKSYETFKDFYALKAADFSNSDFEDETLKINLEYLRKTGSVVEAHEDNKPGIAIMSYFSMIK